MPSSLSILDHFSALTAPHRRWRVVYPLPEILLLIPCATLCGMDDFVEIRLWGEQRLDFLRRFQPYACGLPAHDTLDALDADLFKAGFTAWAAVSASCSARRRSPTRARRSPPSPAVRSGSNSGAPSSPSTRWAPEPPSPRPSWPGAATVCWRSRATAPLPTTTCASSPIRVRRSPTSIRASTRTLAASNAVAPACATTSLGWSLIAAIPASRTGPLSRPLRGHPPPHKSGPPRSGLPDSDRRLRISGRPEIRRGEGSRRG